MAYHPVLLHHFHEAGIALMLFFPCYDFGR